MRIQKKTGSPPSMLRGACAAAFRERSPAEILTFFQNTGAERFERKTRKILSLMLAEGSRGAFLRILFDFLGVRRNRENFAVLFRETVEKYPKNLFDSGYEAILWGESGLLPPSGDSNAGETVRAELNRLWDAWWRLRRDAGERILWNRGAVRPSGTPERKIAVLCAILRKNGTDPLAEWTILMKKAESPEAFAGSLAEAFRCENPFWEKRFSFSSPEGRSPSVLVGESRARELAADVGLPCLAARALLTGDSGTAARAKLVFQRLPGPGTDGVIRRAAERWFDDPRSALRLLSSAAARQGIHHVDSEYCVRLAEGSCTGCPVTGLLRGEKPDGQA